MGIRISFPGRGAGGDVDKRRGCGRRLLALDGGLALVVLAGGDGCSLLVVLNAAVGLSLGGVSKGSSSSK